MAVPISIGAAFALRLITLKINFDERKLQLHLGAGEIWTFGCDPFF